MGRYYWIGVAALLYGVQAWAGDVEVSGAWTRATAPGQSGAVIRFSITSRKDAQLLEISSPVAGVVEMHNMTHDNGVMKMRPIGSLPLPAGRAVDLAGEGNHAMLLNLKQPLKAGDSVPFSLTVQFADKRKVTVKAKAEVRSLTATP